MLVQKSFNAGESESEARDCKQRWTRHGKKHGKAQARRKRNSVSMPSCVLSSCFSATSLFSRALARPRLQTVCVGNATFLKLQPHTNLHLPREGVCFATVRLSFLFSLFRVSCRWTAQNTFVLAKQVFLQLFFCMSLVGPWRSQTSSISELQV